MNESNHLRDEATTALLKKISHPKLQFLKNDSSVLSAFINEAISIAKITYPLALTGLFLYIRYFVSFSLIGGLRDATLAGGFLAAAAFANITGSSLFSGLTMGVESIRSLAFGARRYKHVRKIIKRGFILLLLISLPVALLWMNSVHSGSIELRQRQHQVFLNFRGEELHYNFVSHVVDAFERNHIHFFVDSNEQRGKDLQNLFLRIQESNIFLAIFSTRYAESSFCLDELVKMKKLSDKGNLISIPVFYKVKAEEVRNQTGEFGDNFWTLAKVSSGNQIKEWKEALEYISDKMGLSFGEKMSEADFVKEIVKACSECLATI